MSAPQMRGIKPALAYPFERGMCELLGLGKTTAYRELREGRIETYLVGRRRYVSHDELVNYMKRMRAASAAGEQGVRAP